MFQVFAQSAELGSRCIASFETEEAAWTFMQGLEALPGWRENMFFMVSE